jgi:hypothetical protein
VPPTCARSWGTWERWLADSRMYADAAPAPYALDVQRSAVGGTMRASGGPGGNGGLWIADAGGIGAARLGAEQESLLGVYGGTSTRGPWRITSRGTLSLVTTKPLPVRLVRALCRQYTRCTEDGRDTGAPPQGAPRCSPSARVVPPVPGAAGALWYTGARVSLGANISTTLRFVLSAPAQRCTDVRQARPLRAAWFRRKCQADTAPPCLVRLATAEPLLQRGDPHAAAHHVHHAARRWLRPRADGRACHAQRCDAGRRWRQPWLRRLAQQPRGGV